MCALVFVQAMDPNQVQKIEVPRRTAQKDYYSSHVKLCKHWVPEAHVLPKDFDSRLDEEDKQWMLSMSIFPA